MDIKINLTLLLLSFTIGGNAQTITNQNQTMNKHHLAEDILSGITNELNVLELRKIIIGYEKKGLLQSEAMEVINELIMIYDENETVYNLLLDLSDFVSGWCQAELRIWPIAPKG